MTDAAKEARRAYRKEWYKNNRDKVRAYNEKHWEKKARELAESIQAGRS